MPQSVGYVLLRNQFHDIRPFADQQSQPAGQYLQADKVRPVARAHVVQQPALCLNCPKLEAPTGKGEEKEEVKETFRIFCF